VHRGRRRANRTRTLRLAGVAAIAALAAAPLLTLPDPTGPSTPAAPSSPASDGAMRIPKFLSLDYGVVLYFHADTCREFVAVTEDGGSTWSELREVPMFPGEEAVEAELHCLVDNVIPIATDTIVRSAHGYELAYWAAGEDPPTKSYISYDAGRTWQEYEPRVRTADAVPDGVIPSVYCEPPEIPSGEAYPEYREDQDYSDVAPDDLWCHPSQLGWLDPQTGDQMVLRDNPSAVGDLVVGTDGSIWAGGYDAWTEEPPEGDYHVSVSRDRGRTWQDVTPVQGEDIDEPLTERRFLLAAADSDTAYLLSNPWDGGEAEQPTHIYRTTDGGETWQAMPAGQQFREVAAALVARDGTLVVNYFAGDNAAGVPEGIALSRDGAESFQETELMPVGEPIPGGFYGYMYDTSTETAFRGLSEDGLTWRALDLPEFHLPR
jgi:hypothetical protein